MPRSEQYLEAKGSSAMWSHEYMLELLEETGKNEIKVKMK